jgi:hypothetical protein
VTRTLDPRPGFLGPDPVDTLDQDLANQRVVVVPMEVKLDLRSQGRFLGPSGRGLFR